MRAERAAVRGGKYVPGLIKLDLRPPHERRSVVFKIELARKKGERLVPQCSKAWSRKSNAWREQPLLADLRNSRSGCSPPLSEGARRCADSVGAGIQVAVVTFLGPHPTLSLSIALSMLV